MATRREFLAGLAATGLTASRARPGGEPKGRRLPDPNASGLDHIVVLCMENRSFDHYLGWVKGAKGRQRGLEYLDEAGVAHATHHLATYTGCGSNDPSHSYNGGRIQLNGGACDGFRRGSNDDFALGYYTGGGPRPDAASWSTSSPSATAGSQASSPRPIRTASTRIRRRPTGSATRSISAPSPRSGTGWPPQACPRATTTATCPSWRSTAPSTCRSRHRSASSSTTPPRGRCRRTPTSTRPSSVPPERRSPQRRHPPGSEPHGPDRAGVDRRPAVGVDPARHHLRRVGRLLRHRRPPPLPGPGRQPWW